MRRTLLLIAVLVGSSFSVHARASAPTLLPDGVFARPSYDSVIPHEGPLQAGAASGDITPPFGTAATGFFADRHCAASTPLGLFQRTDEIQRDIAADPASAPYAASSCAGGKLGPDTELSARTHPPSAGRYGRLRANAFVLSDGTTTVALVSVDLPAFFGDMHLALAKRVASLGLSQDRILVSASHTHTGPSGYFQQGVGWWAGSDVYDPRTFEVITAGLADAIARAHASMRPARWASGTLDADGLNVNRRAAAWQRNPEAHGLDASNAPRIGMIRFDALDGAPIGAITVFSTHGTIGSADNEWLTGDDKAWASRLLERAIGSGSVVASLNGAQGDIRGAVADTGGWSSDSSDWGGRTGLLGTPHVFGQFARMEDSGVRQVAAQAALWESLAPALQTEISLDARFDRLCFCGQEIADDPYDPFDRGAAEPVNDDPAYHRVSNLAILGVDGQSAPRTIVPGHHRKAPLVVAPPPVVAGTLGTQVLRVGDVAFTTMPGEPSIQMGRRIERSVKAALNGATPDALVRHVWTTALANDHASYFPTIQEYEAYLYESSAAMFGQQTGNAFKARLVEMAERMALGQPTPPCALDRWCTDAVDGSALVASPAPLVPDTGVGQILEQPVGIERFGGTSFSWVGGSPFAEHDPRAPMVRLQRAAGGSWVDVASDLDPDIPVRYRKRYGLHRYTASIDATADFVPGMYRVAVTGWSFHGAGRVRYSLTSNTFEVRVSGGLRLGARGDGLFEIEHPPPDPWSNFRRRLRHSADATGTGTLDGAAVSFTGSITVAAGERLVIEAGGLSDAYGNTNAAPIVIDA